MTQILLVDSSFFLNFTCNTTSNQLSYLLNIISIYSSCNNQFFIPKPQICIKNVLLNYNHVYSSMSPTCYRESSEAVENSHFLHNPPISSVSSKSSSFPHRHLFLSSSARHRENFVVVANVE